MQAIWFFQKTRRSFCSTECHGNGFCAANCGKGFLS